MKQVRMAILMAAIVTFSVITLADTVVGTGTVQTTAQVTGAPEQQVGTVGKVEAPSSQPVPNPPTVQPRTTHKPASTPRWASREQIEAHVLQGNNAPKKRANIRVNRYNTTNNYYLSNKHKGVYREIKTWNPASCSYVDARDQAVLEKAKEYTKGYRDGSTPSQSRDWSWLWWLLGILLALLLLGWLLPKLYHHYDGYVWSVRKPVVIDVEPEPKPEPDIINTAGGEHFGTPLKSAKIAGYNDGQSGVVIRKGVCNLHRGNAWHWAEPNQEVSFDYFAGEDVECVVQIQNIRRVDIPAAGVMIKDTPVGAPVKAGSGQIWIGNENKVCQIPDDLLFELVSGQPIEAEKFINFLPVGKAVNLIYKLDTRPNGYRNNDLTPAPGGQPQTPIEPLVKLATVSEPAAVAEPEPKAEPQKTPAEPEAKSEETKTEMVDRLRKEALRGDYRIPDDFRVYLESLPSEDEVRQHFEQYRQARGRLIYIDKEADRRPDYRKINDLASQIAMGKAKLDEVERKYRGEAVAIEEEIDVGTVEDATAGLLEGLRGEEDEEQ